MTQNFRILVFEDDPEHLKYLKKILATPGCELAFENNVFQATQRFKTQPFDLSVINLETADEDGEELAWWLLENYPRRSVILTGSDLYPEQEELLSYKSVLGFFPAPLHPETLSQMLKKDGKGLKGQVQRMRIPDLLQALRWSQKAVILIFSDATLNQDGWLYLQQGEIVHAEIYQRNLKGGRKHKISMGTEAFQKILKFRNGDFTEQVWQEPEERSLSTPFDGLMMNAATQQDESESTRQEHHGPRIRRALLIEEDAMSRMMLQKGLLAEGIDCESARSLTEANLFLKDGSTDLLVLDAEIETRELSSFLNKLEANYPQLRLIFLGNSSSDKQQTSLISKVLERPINPKRLKEILFEMTQVGFKGYLSRIGVLDFLQLNLSAIDEQKKIHIRDLQSGIDGQIYLAQGRFIHAAFDNLVGEEAFYKIASIEQGDFFEDPAFQPPAESLSDILPHKLMINAGRFAININDEQTETAPETESGVTSLFGDDDIDLSFGLLEQSSPETNAQSAQEGITSLFGNGDIELNFGVSEAPAPDSTSPPAQEGITSLFDENELDDIQFSLGD